jgi:beta-lactamase superfamily II metal-dependent hydrolase
MAPTRKRIARKAVGKNVRRKVVRKKAVRKKAVRKKAVRNKAVRKKAVRKKAVRKKVVRKKAVRKKAVRKKAVRKKAVRKKSTRKNGNMTASPSTPAKPAAGTVTQPSVGGGKAGIRIRMYRVGFGDFFLLSVPGADGSPLHILIDCGVHAADLGTIGDAIADMEKETNGQLALVIMTHRHADHISGFASGSNVFEKFNVAQVWMSWFEDPTEKDAVSFQNTLTAVASNLQATLSARLNASADDAQYLNMAGNATGGLAAVGGLTGNQAALDVLKGGFGNGARVSYYKSGDTPTLPVSLAKAGLTAAILGPPHDLDLVRQLDDKGNQYLAAYGDTGEEPKQFNNVYRATSAAYPPQAFELFSPDEIAHNIEHTPPDVMAAKAAQVDKTLNNQSLVILFTFRGKTLLFAGDAQWGNWQNFLFGGAITPGGNESLTDEAKSILGNIDFYKVGHHGSTNATPIDALTAMREDCVAMCSTQPGWYGTIGNSSEVPRGPLIAALETKTDEQLARSDQIDVEGAHTATMEQKAALLPAPGPLPNIFESGPDGAPLLYIDIEL